MATLPGNQVAAEARPIRESRIGPGWRPPSDGATPGRRALADRSGTGAAQLSRRASGGTETLRRTVLVVGGDGSARAVLVSLLRGTSGLAAAGAATVEDALGFLRGIRVHLVLLDLRTPVASGVEVIERMRLSPATWGIPLIALTPADWPHTEQAARLAGCAAILADPHALDVLVDLVRDVIEYPTIHR
ncbi:MAG TPA: response regulator [Chloroflexota bacterium]|jgi:CheY-like chemotaxis protein